MVMRKTVEIKKKRKAFMYLYAKKYQAGSVLSTGYSDFYRIDG